MNAELSQWLVPALVGMSVLALGAGLLLERRRRQAPLHSRLRQIEAGAQAAAVSGVQPITGVVEQVGKVFAAPRRSIRLKEELAAAGFSSRAAPTIYMGAKMTLFFIALPVGLAATMFFDVPELTRFVLVAALALLLFMLPNLYVYHWRSRRRAEIRMHLPDAIDLMEISVSAGMGLDQAWNSVAGEIRAVSSILADEMALTNLEMHLGASRASALKHMALRTGAEDLSSLVSILVESERFGTSTSDALRSFADELREIRSSRAQEHAEKMAVKMIIPLALFIFPPLLIIILGPAVITLVKTWTQI
jgi:tight adherence protein C